MSTSTVAILREQVLEVEPGVPVSCQLSVYNSGAIVEQFTLDVVGDSAEWASVDPPTLSLFPNTQQDVTVTFHPPREWHVPPGPMPFGVRIAPANDPDGSVVEEGTLIVRDFSRLEGELVPQVASARRHGTMGLAIDSRGNMPVPVVMRGRDTSDSLEILVRPRQVVLEPGQAAFAKLRIKPRKTTLRGSPRQIRFKVFVEPQTPGAEPLTLDGTFIQKPLLPRGSIAIIAVIGALLMWFMVLRPVVQNAAQNAVKPATAAQQTQNAQVQASLAQTQQSIAVLNHTASSLAAASGSTTTTSSPTTSSTTSTTAAAPAKLVTGPITSNSLEDIVAPGTTKTTTYVVPTGDSMTITGIDVYSGSTGGGTVRIQHVYANGPTQTFFGPQSLTTTEAWHVVPLAQTETFAAGDTLQLVVSCGLNRPACDLNLVYGGSFTQPAP